MRFASIHAVRKMRLRPGLPTPQGELAALPYPLAGFKGAASGRRGRGIKGRGRMGKGKRGEGQGGRERGGEVDSDVHLEQGRRLAKGGPENRSKLKTRLGNHGADSQTIFLE